MQEIPDEGDEGKASRLMKKRKDTRGRSPTPLRRWRVMLRPSPPSEVPGEAEFQEDAPAEAVQEDVTELTAQEGVLTDADTGGHEEQ